MTNVFSGYNHSLTCQDGELYEAMNVTNDNFPILSTRKKRGIYKKLSKPQGLLGGEKLAYVDDNKLYYDDVLITQLDTTDAQRQMVIMGAYLVVFPDGVIYNTQTEELDVIANKNVSAVNPTFTLCKLDGTNYDSNNTVTSDEEPSKDKYWIDTSEPTVVIKYYSESYAMWQSVPTTYVKVQATGIGKGFSKYDAATFSGVDANMGYNDYDFNTSNIIYDCGDNFLVIAGLINQVKTNSKPITVERVLPKMDFVCEMNNRIWGCSSEKHEIYACKLGDPKNWQFYAGLNNDSYAVTVGSEDDFTGVCSYSSIIYFFKEQGVHRVYGNQPSDFQVSWLAGRGIQKGSAKSIEVVADSIIFKARDGVSIYDGSTNIISSQLGGQFYDAVAGTYRNKYYISMRDEANNYAIYVYDTLKGTWAVEDHKKITDMAYTNNGLFMLDDEGYLQVTNMESNYYLAVPSEDLYPSEYLWCGKSVQGEAEPDIKWMFTTGEYGLDTPYEKYIKRLNIRMELGNSTRMRVEVMYDGSEDWEELATYYVTRKRSVSLPLKVRRCDYLRLRFSGVGDFKLYSIARVTEEGGEA